VSGPLRRQGQDAYDGIRLWVDHVVDATSLRFGRIEQTASPPRRLDDASSARALGERSAVADPRSALISSSDLWERIDACRRALAAAHGKILWNHGGAADEVASRARA